MGFGEQTSIRGNLISSSSQRGPTWAAEGPQKGAVLIWGRLDSAARVAGHPSLPP